MAKKYKDNGDGTAATSSDKVSFEVMVNKSFVRVFYRVPVKDIMQYMEEQVEKTTVVNPMTFPFRRMRCDNYQLTANQTQIDINDVFRGRSPRLFWLVLVDDERYQGHFGKNPFDFTPQNGIQVECTANGVPVPKASLSLQDKYEIFDLLMNASGKRKRDAYLLNPDTFDQGYFMVPFDLTAVQDGGESSTPLLRMLVNVRLTFSSGNPTLQALFFYNTDESLLQVDNRDVYGADEVPCQAPYPQCAIANTDPIDLPGQHWVGLFWWAPGRSEFFDSYAITPNTYDARWRCFDDFEQTPRPIQQWTTDVCGDHTLYYLYHRCRGTPLRTIVQYFSPTNLLYNDTAVVQRMHDLFPSLSSEKHRGGHLFDAHGHSQICIERQRHRCYDCCKPVTKAIN
ncbi:hypothetical protein ACROYT_G007306 [Oculina patagonica]